MSINNLPPLPRLRLQRDNQILATRPEDLVFEFPKKRWLVTTNRHVGISDTFAPYQDTEHPNGVFNSREDALVVANEVFNGFQEQTEVQPNNNDEPPQALPVPEPDRLLNNPFNRQR